MKIAVIGLGYVGLPLAVSFKEKNMDIIGFDINESKINNYKNGIDVTFEVGNDRLLNSNLSFSSNVNDIRNCNVFIVAVPTPVTSENIPDFTPIEKSSELIASVLKKDDIVIYESTVYPGVTEDICGRILSDISGLVSGVDFKLAYSPERINPGDKTNRLETIVKVVSGQDDETLEKVAKLYEQIIIPGVHRASSIKVAEAAKVIENAQRDINIAFVNELSNIFNILDIDTEEVLKAAGSKWNFLNFKPGLVGGHCIGVDPFYLAYKAKEVGYHAKIIISGRQVNDEMSSRIASDIIAKLSKLNKPLKDCKVAMCGLTFKENCPDTRNSKVFDIIDELKKFNVQLILHDDVADQIDEYTNNKKVSWDEINNVDAIVFSVNHDYFRKIQVNDLKDKYAKGSNILIDLKWLYDPKEVKDFDYYRL